MSEYFYVHHGAKLTLTVEAHHPDEARNALTVKAVSEGWPVSGWTLEPKPPKVTRVDAGLRVLGHTS